MVIVVFGDAAAVWHEVPGVGWSVDAVERSVKVLFPDDIGNASRSHISNGIVCNLVT